MYIYCSSNKEQTFVRFGKRFKHGKSINYLAMNPRIKDIYSERLAELQYGYITEEEFNDWCEQALDTYVWEPHTSCFKCDPDTELPIVENVSQVKTLIGFIQRLESNLPCPAFIVKGTQVGTGTDKEPLVDVTYEEPIEYDITDLIDVVLDALDTGFKVSNTVSTNTDNFEHIQGLTFQYKNRQFSYPISWFIQDFEYTGKVMDKFKFENQVDIDYDDLVCIFIDAESNGGKEEVADCIWSWGNSIYDKPYNFENQYHLAIDISPNGDIYAYGQSDDIWDFTDDNPVDYDEVDVPSKLAQKFQSMKFYE